MQQIAAHGRPDPPLQNRVGDGDAVVAGSGLAIGAAAPAIGRNDDDGAAAAGAAQLARKKARLARLATARAAGVIQALLDALPSGLVDDAQFGDFLADQVFGFVRFRDAAPGIRVFAEGLPIIDDFADIEAIMQDAVAALPVPDDCIRPPMAAAWRWDAFGIQLARDRAGAFPFSIGREDAADDGRLVFIDFAQPAFRLAIFAEGANLAVAIGEPAGDAAGLDPAGMAAPDLFAQLFQEQRRHRPAQADVHRPDFAFGQRDDAAAGKADALEDAGQVFLVARNPIETFGQQDGGAAGVDCGDRRDQPWPVADGAADRRVGFLGDDAPAFPIGALAQDAQLVFDRFLRLHRRGIAGVKDGIGHLRGAESLVLSAIMARTRRLAK